jgi:hypothetical protein
MIDHETNWQKIAAVTTGGKPYFYRLHDVGGCWRASIVWNRRVQAYAVEVVKVLENGIRTGINVGYVSTVPAGKRLAAKTLDCAA